MAIVLLIIGAIFIVASVRGEHEKLFDVLKDDFTGPNNFFVWGLAIFFIGALGYSRTIRPLSNSFLVLLFVVILLTSGRGFFDQFMRQIRSA
jgi:hypothetical protein